MNRTRTFLRQVEFFELGSFLVELGLQLLLELDELGPLLLQSRHSLLEHLWTTGSKQHETVTHQMLVDMLKTTRKNSSKNTIRK